VVVAKGGELLAVGWGDGVAAAVQPRTTTAAVATGNASRRDEALIGNRSRVIAGAPSIDAVARFAACCC
jgi:hypothetical protein